MSASLIEGWNHAVARGDSARDPRSNHRILIARADKDRASNLRGPDERRPKGKLPSKATRLWHSSRGHLCSLSRAELLEECTIGERVHWIGVEWSPKAVANAGH